MNCLFQTSRRPLNGFTIAELLIALGIMGLVMGGTLGVYITQQRLSRDTILHMEADHDLNMAISRFVYGAGLRSGIRSASSAALASSGGGWTLTYVAGNLQTNTIRYQSAQSNLIFNPGNITIGENISSARVVVAGDTVSVTMRVDRARGRFTAHRTAGTTLRMRN